jgi:hypothetical protein
VLARGAIRNHCTDPDAGPRADFAHSGDGTVPMKQPVERGLAIEVFEEITELRVTAAVLV